MSDMYAKDIPIVTIDGPSGCGKGTTSQLLAKELGWHLLDSGALYRIVGWAIHEQGIDAQDESVVRALIAELDVSFKASEFGEPAAIWSQGQDITHQVRSQEGGVRASKIAVLPYVRNSLLELQHAFVQPPGLVADGRDMGTVVFVDAGFKFYLDASPVERAKRRYDQLKEKGINVSLRQIQQELEERDGRDKGRTIAPLRPAADALIIDTSDLSIDQVFSEILQRLRERLH